MSLPLITVLTPTYNRAHLLPRLFQSLCDQTYTCFEWILVDDGSTDNTREIVRGFQSEHKITMQYIAQPNGGKHRAINHGVRLAQGEVVIILDSDDSLPSQSLATIKHYYCQIADDSSFGGVCGCMAHHDGRPINRGVLRRPIDAKEYDIRNRWNIKGDLAEVFRTSVLKEFPFPEFEGERFCPEDLVWNRIAQKYKLRLFPDIIYYRDYLDDGLTSKMIEISVKSPVATTMMYAEKTALPIPFVPRLKAAVNYWRFHFYCPASRLKTIKWYWWCAYPLALWFHARDLKMLSRSNRT